MKQEGWSAAGEVSTKIQADSDRQGFSATLIERLRLLNLAACRFADQCLSIREAASGQIRFHQRDTVF
jgi:hypothetical protein